MYDVPSTIYFYPVKLLPILAITLLLITAYFGSRVSIMSWGMGQQHKQLIYMHSGKLHGEEVAMYANCSCALVCVAIRHSACLVAWQQACNEIGDISCYLKCMAQKDNHYEATKQFIGYVGVNIC